MSDKKRPQQETRMSDQDLNTTSSPTFAGLKLTGIAAVAGQLYVVMINGAGQLIAAQELIANTIDSPDGSVHLTLFQSRLDITIGGTFYSLTPTAYETPGTVIAGKGVIFPKEDPLVAEAWWDNAGTLTKSTGP